MIQYLHLNKNILKGFKKTFAFETPEASSFFEAIEAKLKGHSRIIGIKVGSSKVNPEDNYCKATGREYSKERLQKEGFVIANIDFSKKGKIDLILIEHHDSMAIKVGLQLGQTQARILDIQLDKY